MSRRVRRQPEHTPPSYLIDVIGPRANGASIGSADNFFAAVSLPEPFAAEIWGSDRERLFLLRANSEGLRRHLLRQISVPYAQAELRSRTADGPPGTVPGSDPAGAPPPLPKYRRGMRAVGDSIGGHDRSQSGDPARCRPDERAMAVTLKLQEPPYLPIRIVEDADVDPRRAEQADPLLGLLGALTPPGTAGDAADPGRPAHWRLGIQLILRPADPRWMRPYARMAQEIPLAQVEQRGHADTGGSPWGPLILLIPVLAILIGLRVREWYRAGAWGSLALAALGLLLALGLGVALVRAFRKQPLYDPRLVAQKIAGAAFEAEVRLAVIAPTDEPEEELVAALDRLAAAFNQFGLATGNRFGLVPLTLPDDDAALARPGFLGRGRPDILNSREVASLWHLPRGGDDAPLVERALVRRHLPVARIVAPEPGGHSCHVGRSSNHELTVPVHLHADTLAGNTLLAGMPGRGKSSLFQHAAGHFMETGDALVVVDNHGDLARAILAQVPPARAADTVWIDLADPDTIPGYNLIDAGLGLKRGQAVRNALTLFQYQYHENWGPRMADAFRFGLHSLYLANERLLAGKDGAAREAARQEQYTILDLTALFIDDAFRAAMLDEEGDRIVGNWWRDYLGSLDRRATLEIANPVFSKINEYAATEEARAIVGQPCSTIDPREWVAAGRVVIIDGAAGIIGEAAASLITGALLNAVKLAIAGQARLPAAERRSVRLLIDEFHTIPGADYEYLLAEARKFGGSIWLATQNLGRLAELKRLDGKTLQRTLFSTVNNTFAFQVSMTDAKILADEFSDPARVAAEDLTGLPHYACYARIHADRRPHAPFFIELAPPTPGDPAHAAALAAESAACFGATREEVDATLTWAQERRDALAQQGKAILKRRQSAAGTQQRTAAGPTTATAPPAPRSKGPTGIRGGQRLPDPRQRALPVFGTLQIAPPTEE